jgi:hypothetical protein
MVLVLNVYYFRYLAIATWFGRGTAEMQDRQAILVSRFVISKVALTEVRTAARWSIVPALSSLLATQKHFISFCCILCEASWCIKI